MTSSHPHIPRPTIGFLCSALEETYMQHIWSGIVEAARERYANLLCFKGEHLAPSLSPDKRPSNILYTIAHEYPLDGVVIIGAIAVELSLNAFREFCDSYRPLPVLTIGLHMPGFPSIGVDNASGIREVISHLIDVHGCRRIGFIKGPAGNPEANVRYHAYSEALDAHGLSVDPKLSLPAEFTYVSGKQAVQRLFQQGRPDIDALVAVNDLTALGALDAFHEIGWRVPEDIALAGFDDIDEAHFVTPPLTTVRQPLDELGRRAVEQLLCLIDGEEVAEEEVLPTTMVTRQSCGCLDQEIFCIEVTPGETPAIHEAPHTRDEILSWVFQVFETYECPIDHEQVARLLEALLDDIEGMSSGAFLATFYELLVTSRERIAKRWQQGLSLLRYTLLQWYSERKHALELETLFQQARVLFGEVMEQLQGPLHMESRRNFANIQRVLHELNATFDIERIRNILAGILQQLRIPRGYVIVYDSSEQPLESARMVFAYVDGEVFPVTPASFPTSELVPDQGMLWNNGTCFLVEALYLQSQQVGLALFEIGPQEGLIYEVLRTQLSSSLYGAVLLQRQQQARQILELQPVIQHVLDVLLYLTSASDTLTQISTEMASSTEEVSQQVSSVSESSHHISQVIQEVSTAAREETASMTEISTTVEQVMALMTKPVESAQTANATMISLADSSQQIGDILSVISGVAKQTKFLALYAAIVAAQSGDFEANFTVVATEIKALAQKTADSAKDIAQKIRAIQLSSQDAVDAISRVVVSIQEVSEHSAVISTAITEQSATTSQISRTITDMSGQSDAITQTTTEVATVAQEASSRAARVQQAAQKLSTLAERLQGLVVQFTEVSEAV